MKMLANATFDKADANAKNCLALGVSVNAVVYARHGRELMG
jgi:hypothetical protein